eukprot:TRINITY_DN52745_c0_g1_i1.p1 TRINITY_DN52745_c0_g1~~TRINITY_DN52745_c0_g1_i1.p1  ORF type:complete len:118 (-),score=24.77 TRINITY_DN52745_c0_g1_i1:96-449(-)
MPRQVDHREVAKSAPLLSTLSGARRPSTAGGKPRQINLGRRELIGKGSFGMVYKGIDLESNRLLAIKEISLVGSNVQQLPTLSLIHISEPTRLLSISYAVFCLKKKKKSKSTHKNNN